MPIVDLSPTAKMKRSNHILKMSMTCYGKNALLNEYSLNNSVYSNQTRNGSLSFQRR